MTELAITILLILGISTVIGYVCSLAIYYRGQSNDDFKQFLITMLVLCIVVVDVFLIMEAIALFIEKHYLIPQAL
ncbi:hypothetical protein SM033_00106 [Vibrio phage vB_VpaM_sm033]|nr:hypothetical protein SM033_00106 [Vibrio phage vB_VpaM_sm033]